MIMYAVIRTGGKQYRVKEGDQLNLERLPGEAGETITFEDVLAKGEGADLQVGTPTIAGAKVSAEIVRQARAKKIIVFKFKRRKNYMRKKGHRQYYTRVKITGIA
jgi:large subunit ribosomal protein L21